MLAWLAASCGSDIAGPGPTTLTLDAKSATTLAGNVGTAVTPVPDVVVKRGGAPAAGIEVTFAVSSGGGAVERATATSDASGAASPGNWVLGPEPGRQTLTVTAPTLPNRSIVFTATAAVGEPAGLAFTVPPSLSAADRAIAPAVQVSVTDAFGNRVSASVQVAVALADGPAGTLSGTLSVPAVNGVATFDDLRISATRNDYRLVASSPSLTAVTSAPFDIVAGGAAVMAVFEGDGQTGVVATPVDVAPAVKLLDASGNPVAGVSVTFVPGNGGSVTGGSALSAPDGIARATSWTLGPVAGSQSLTATAAGGAFTGNPLTFAAAAAPGPPSATRSAIQALQSSIAAGGGTATIRVTVRDEYGNLVNGASVTLTASGSENQLVQPPPSANGIAEGTITSTRAEAKTLHASVGGAAVPGSATVVVTPGPAASVTMNPAGITGIVAGETLAMSATARDGYGNVIPNTTFAWSSTRPTVATVSGTGIVTGQAPVSTQIRATAGGITGSTEVAVYGAMMLDSLTYCAPNGQALTLDMFAPSASYARPAPIAIYVHGGGWIAGDSKGGWQFDAFKSTLHSKGFIVASLDYRLAPGSGGSRMWRAQGQDVACAIRFLRASALRYGIDPDRIAVWGRSAGGHLAALLGLTTDDFGYSSEHAGYSSRVQAVVGLAGVYDLTRPSQVPALVGQHETRDSVFRGWPVDSTSSYIIGASPTRLVGSTAAKFLIIYPEFDTDVLPPQSIALHNALVGRGLNSELLPMLHADHSLDPVAGYTETDPARADVVTIIANFFDAALNPGAAASPLVSARRGPVPLTSEAAPKPPRTGQTARGFTRAY